MDQATKIREIAQDHHMRELWHWTKQASSYFGIDRLLNFPDPEHGPRVWTKLAHMPAVMDLVLADPKVSKCLFGGAELIEFQLNPNPGVALLDRHHTIDTSEPRADDYIPSMLDVRIYYPSKTWVEVGATKIKKSAAILSNWVDEYVEPFMLDLPAYETALKTGSYFFFEPGVMRCKKHKTEGETKSKMCFKCKPSARWNDSPPKIHA